MGQLVKQIDTAVAIEHTANYIIEESHTKDYKLVQSVLLGDVAAWNILYRNSYDIVHGYVAKRCYNIFVQWELPEDIISETFKIGYDHLCKYQGKSRFSTWLCGIAKNIILENNRKNYKEIELIKRISHSHLHNKYLNPELIVIINERDFYIRRAFHSLSAKHQVLIHYIVFMEMNRKEVAKQVGISLSECAQEYQRAIYKLKKNFIYLYYGQGVQKWHSLRL